MTGYLEPPDDAWELEHEKFQLTVGYEVALAAWVEDTFSMVRLRNVIGQTPLELDAEFQASNDYADCFERWHEDRLGRDD